jgi:hypothetical protein
VVNEETVICALSSEKKYQITLNILDGLGQKYSVQLVNFYVSMEKINN